MKENNEKQYIISAKRLLELLIAEEKLGLLECNGVDNWMSYGEAANNIGAEYPDEENMQEFLNNFEEYNGK